MSRSIHPEAEQDVADAAAFYNEHAGPLVAGRFLSEFERVARLLIEHPGFGTPISKKRRIFPLRTFPYSVVYSHPDDQVRILVVQHQHRKPGYASSRQ